METIDWSKAPDDAEFAGTVVGVQVQVFYKNVSSDSFEYCYGDDYGWSGLVYGEPYCKPLIPRPPQQWSGDGLPPAGVVCEAHFVGEWVKFEMRYYGDAYVVFKTQFEVQRTRHDFDTCGVKFRPIRTPEQIAADERSKECDRMFGVIIDRIPEDRRHNRSDIVEALYDAGCRLPKP